MPSSEKSPENSYYGKKYNPPHEAPPLLKTLVIIFLGAVALFGLDHYAGTHFFATEGPLSSSHAMLGPDCANCHTPNWTRAGEDMQARCMRCHSEIKQLKFHVESHRRHLQKQRVISEIFCIDCHKEHRGRDVTPASISDSNCRSCHQIRHVETDHPNFKAEKLEEARLEKIGLEFNHGVHWKNDKNTEEINKKFETGCPLCHVFDSEQYFLDFKANTFESNCRDCHPLQELSITNMFPEEELESLAGAIKNLATRFGFENYDTFLSRFQYEEGNKRRRRPPAFRYRPVHEDPYLNMWFSQKAMPSDDVKSILSQGRKGTTLNCLKCHVLMEDQNKANPRLNVGKSFTLAPIAGSAETRVTRFPHKKHVQMGCEKCHADILKSKSLADFNVTVNTTTCFNCHNNIMVKNECNSCHNFHQRMNQSALVKLVATGNLDSILKNQVSAGPSDDP
ncbi:MAG: hypothetical protein COV67_10310 [Nitrospinae bacterium CG11_big_fil_rev_8_21_14_0_20_56_8]|nr:MAG: hypothetical protein COV67_10310 [Nitrospinae bacterium CG11_big_fil_rev_8_21_14_0_20_56_8]